MVRKSKKVLKQERRDTKTGNRYFHLLCALFSVTAFAMLFLQGILDQIKGILDVAAVEFFLSFVFLAITKHCKRRFKRD